MLRGGESVNTTYMMVFQEMTEKVSINQSDTNIARITANHVKESTSGIKIDPSLVPQMFPQLAKTFKILHE